MNDTFKEALKKFKEQTGYDFIELLHNKELVDEFLKTNGCEEYLEEAKNTRERIAEIQFDLENAKPIENPVYLLQDKKNKYNFED